MFSATVTWAGVPVQRCTVHKERNLLAHAPKALHEEIKADHSDMMYANTAGEAIASTRPSSRNGACAVAASPTVWRRPAIGCRGQLHLEAGVNAYANQT